MNSFIPKTEGVFYGVPEAIYRQAPGISNSSLKGIDQSPAHYLARLRTPWETTQAQVIGHITHTATLEPHLPPLYVVRPAGLTFTTKEGKAWRDSQSLPIITEEEAAQISGMSAAVNRHPFARSILNRSEKEVSAFKLDEATGLLIKGRADMVFMDDDNHTVVADLKTCEDARPAQFMRDAAKWQYHRQAAFYCDLFGASQFVFICVEKSAPHGVTVMQYSPEAIQTGRTMYRAALATIAACQATNDWPGYSHEIAEIGLPYYAR